MCYLHGFVLERSPDIRQRILDHNEDDCRATRVLLAGIRSLAPATAAGSIFVSVNNLRSEFVVSAKTMRLTVTWRPPAACTFLQCH